MANRVPLIVDTSTLNIKELPASDNLDLSSSGLLGVTKIGINTAATKNTLEVIGNANISGIVTATTFIGNVTGTITGNATGLTGEPDIIVRNVRATGITTYEDTRNVDSIGIITARSDVHVGAGLSVIGISTFTGAIDANGNIDIAGNTVLNGNVDLGNATSDTITATGRFDSDLVPSSDDARDLGTSALQWKDLFVDGAANIDTLNVDGVATFTADVTFDNGTNAGKDIVWDESDNQLEFSDDVKASFGGGNDLQIYHQSSNNHSYIKEAGSGSLIVLADDLYIQDTSTNTMIKATEGGNVELSHNGTKTFETTNLGAKVTGGLEVTGVSTFTGAIDANSNIDVNGTISITGVDIDLGSNGLDTGDNKGLKFGDGDDFLVYHLGGGSGPNVIDNSGNDSGGLEIRHNAEVQAKFVPDVEVILYHDNAVRITTTADGADIGGTGSLKIPVGTTGQRSGSPTNGDFRYNSTDDQFEGYSDGWCGAIGGGAQESDTSVSTTNATAVYTVAHATYRFASLILQITQGSAYQSGRYMVIHDGTTATIVEESAVATGSMLGTFTADINGSNLRVLVNMGSSSSATVTVIPTPVTV